jgi:GNAT superfamily N-acetyltransferase
MNCQNVKSIAHRNHVAGREIFPPIAPEMSCLRLLGNSNEKEVLEFLNVRPVHTVAMASFIRDNGMEGADNRGNFYGYRSVRGTLEAVALIGHTTLIEARSEDSLKALALIARQSETPIHFMMSDGQAIETFWNYYAGGNRAPRLVCPELLFELTFPFTAQKCKWNVRLAEASELGQIAVAHDEVAFIESGSSPLTKDGTDFLKRCLKRIEQRRTFVVFENGRLVFKADIAAETSDVIYLEGIYVAPEYRGQGVGSSCLANLGLQLIERVENVCLLSNVEFKNAHCSFLKAGFRNTGSCQTIFV